MAGAPAVSPIPGADVYGQEATLANNAYNSALAQINKNRMNTLTQFGYTGTVDPTTGVLSGIGVDPHSMFGALQQQLHGDALDDRSADMAASDRGLLGGLAHQGHSLAHYSHGAALTSLGQQLTGSLDQLQNQQQTAGETRDAALWQAEQDQLNAELAAEPNQTLDQLLNQGQDTGSDDGSSGGGSGGSSNTPTYKPEKATTTSGGRAPTYRGVRDFKQHAQKKIIYRARPGRDR